MDLATEAYPFWKMFGPLSGKAQKAGVGRAKRAFGCAFGGGRGCGIQGGGRKKGGTYPFAIMLGLKSCSSCLFENLKT